MPQSSCSTNWLSKGGRDDRPAVPGVRGPGRPDPPRHGGPPATAHAGGDMVARLCAGDATVGDLAAPYEVSLQAVSKHLKVLEGAGLVTRGRDAQRRPVHLEAEVFDLMTKWIERYRREAEQRYRRLDAVLAAMQE